MNRYFLKQLQSPSGIFGKYVLPKLWNRRNRMLNDVTFDALEVQTTDRVLEVGFGGGYLLNRILPAVADGYAAGVDASDAIVKQSQGRFQKPIQSGRMEIICAGAENLPFPQESFNKVCSVNSIFYWNCIARGLSEIYRVLQKDGIFVMTFTSEACLRDRFSQTDWRFFDSDSMGSVLSEAGFRNMRCETREDHYRIFHCCVAKK